MGVLGSTCWHRAGFTHGGNVVRIFKAFETGFYKLMRMIITMMMR